MNPRLLALLAAVAGGIVGYFLPWPILIFITIAMWIWFIFFTPAAYGNLIYRLLTIVPFLGLAWLILLFRALLIP